MPELSCGKVRYRKIRYRPYFQKATSSHIAHFVQTVPNYLEELSDFGLPEESLTSFGVTPSFLVMNVVPLGS